MGSAPTAPPAPHWTRPDRAAAWAVATGATGVLANVLLVLFFALAQPWQDSGGPWAWLGPANDVVIVAQYLTFLPVPLALRDRLPDTGAVLAATVAGLVAMLAVIVLQVLLIVGALRFETQVTYVVAAFLMVFLWVLATSRTAYRTAALPRRIARAGLLIGSAFPIGIVVAAIALLAPDGSPARYVGLGVGLALSTPSWLALPVWPLLLAGRVFVASPADRGNYRKEER